MRPKQKNHTALDWMQAAAVVLLVGVGGFLVISTSNGSLHANGDSKSDNHSQVVIADVDSSQPSTIAQLEDQTVAEFSITTEQSSPVTISGVTFSAQGTLAYQIVQLLTRYPLTVVDGEGTVLGEGETWLYDGRIVQTIELDPPVAVSNVAPLELGVVVDLIGQINETFGVSLIDVITPEEVIVRGLPAEGRLMEIKDRL